MSNITVFHIVYDELNFQNLKYIKDLAYKAKENANRLTNLYIQGGFFKKVAEIENCDHLDSAYRLTNSIECGWWKNEEVIPLFDGDGAKSTDIGDILLKEITLEPKTDNDAMSHFELWIVAPIGFVKIDG